MSAPLTRILATLRLRSVVYVRSPDGQLSKAVVKYASGQRLKTNTRQFDRRTGEEVNVPEGHQPHTLYAPTEALAAEYAAQAGSAFAGSRLRVNAKTVAQPV